MSQTTGEASGLFRESAPAKAAGYGTEARAGGSRHPLLSEVRDGG